MTNISGCFWMLPVEGSGSIHPGAKVPEASVWKVPDVSCVVYCPGVFLRSPYIRGGPVSRTSSKQQHLTSNHPGVLPAFFCYD
jgi:hypothetical protein